MEYSIEQGIFNAIFFSSLPEDEEITGDYLSVDESGQLLLIGILENELAFMHRFLHELVLHVYTIL